MLFRVKKPLFFMRRPQLSLLLFLLFTIILTVLYVSYNVIQPVIPAVKLSGLHGMSKTDVYKLLGEPTETIGRKQLIYTHPWRFGWVAISLDTNDRVSGVNDESAFPAN